MKNILINPNELAKRTKESSRTVSLRIKEKTWLGFEQLAKDNRTTANALISELADFYIESLNSNLDLSDNAVNSNKFKTALEKEVRRMCRLAIDDIIRDDGLFSVAYWETTGEKTMFLFMKEHMPTTIDGQFEMSGYLGSGETAIYPTKTNKKASYSPGAWDPRASFKNLLVIPFEKAPDVIHLLKFVETNAENNDIKIKFDDIDFMDKLADIVTNHDYEYEEKQKDGQIEQICNKQERQAMLNEIVQLCLAQV